MKTHKAECECEVCKNGLAFFKEKEQRLIDKHGWLVHFVPGSKEVPFEMNVHTHGLLENFGHLDLQICLQMSPDTCHSILITAIEDNIKKGKAYKAGEKYDGLIASNSDVPYQVLFLEAQEGNRTVLRMVFPDKDGGFDGPMSKQLEGCNIPDGTVLSANVSNVS